MGVRILPITLSFLIPNFFYIRDVYLPDRLLFRWLGCIVKLSSRRRPFTGAAVAWSSSGVETKDSETSPKVPPMGGAFW